MVAKNTREHDECVEAVPKGRGRHRSSESEAAVLSATAELLKELPLREITIEEIAKRAHVGKATIYKWWPSKAFVALDAFLKTMRRNVGVPDTGSAILDFTEQLRSVIHFYNTPTGAMFRQFLAEGQSDEAFKKHFNERFLKSRRADVTVMWERAIKRKEINPQLDVDLVLDLIYGPLVFRVMTGHAPLNDQQAEEMVAAVFSGIQYRCAPSKP